MGNSGNGPQVREQDLSAYPSPVIEYAHVGSPRVSRGAYRGPVLPGSPGAGGIFWAASYGHDHYQREYIYELGEPWKAREVWDRVSSAFYNVEKITTPTLIMGGESDWNVPILNSEHLYQALRQLGRTTALVVYPGQHHGISKPSYQKDLYERYLAWYDKYVKGEPASVSK